MSLIQVSTSATNGAAFVPFAGNRAGNGSITNDTGVSLDLRLSPSGPVTVIAAGLRFPFNLVWSTAEVEVRRTDQVATAVTVELEFSMGSLPPAHGGAYDPVGTAAAAVAAHNESTTAHLNIVRRTLAGNLALTAADLPQQKIIPDADRDVTLPAESTAQWMFEIRHGGAAYVITLKRAGGTTVASLIPGSPVVVAWDGVAFGMC